MLDVLTGSKFNAKVDADSIMATLARQTGQTISDVEGGIEYFPHNSTVIRKGKGVVRWSGSGIVLKADDFFKITNWQDDYARRLVRFLNYELNFDGCWAVVWCNPTEDGYATELRYGYQDADGDLQFVIGCDLTLVDLQAKDDARRHGNAAVEAYKTWQNWKKDVDVQPGQTIKAAQGERSRDPTVQPIL